MSPTLSKIIFPIARLLPHCKLGALAHPPQRRSVLCRNKLKLLHVRVTTCRPFPIAHVFCICHWPMLLWDGESFPHSTKEPVHTKSCPYLPSGRLLLDYRPLLYSIYHFFALLQSPFIVALLAQVDHKRCASIFRHNSRISEITDSQMAESDPCSTESTLLDGGVPFSQPPLPDPGWRHDTLTCSPTCSLAVRSFLPWRDLEAPHQLL